MTYLIPLILFFLIYAYIAWRDFVLAIALFAFLLPAYLIRFQIGPFPSTALEVMIGILALFWVFQLIKRPKDVLQLPKKTFFWPGLALVAASGITMIWAPDLNAAAGIWKAYFVEPFLFYLILTDTLRDKKDWQKVFVALGALTLVVTLLAFFQRITGWWSPTWQWTLPGQRRVTAFFTSPNALGLLIAPITAMYFAWFFLKEKLFERLEWYQLVVVLSGLLAIGLAISRGAIIGLSAAMLLVLYMIGEKKKVLGVVIIGLALALALPQARNFATFQNDSGQSRLSLYEGSIELIKQHPFQGTGLSGFAAAFENVRPDGFTEDLIYPHNIFLNFWLETGLLGLLAVLWIMFLVVKMAIKQRNVTWVWVFLMGLVPMLIHGLIDVPYFKNDLAMLTWFVLAGLTWSEQKKSGIISAT